MLKGGLDSLPGMGFSVMLMSRQEEFADSWSFHGRVADAISRQPNITFPLFPG